MEAEVSSEAAAFSSEIAERELIASTTTALEASVASAALVMVPTPPTVKAISWINLSMLETVRSRTAFCSSIAERTSSAFFTAP